MRTFVIVGAALVFATTAGFAAAVGKPVPRPVVSPARAVVPMPIPKPENGLALTSAPAVEPAPVMNAPGWGPQAMDSSAKPAPSTPETQQTGIVKPVKVYWMLSGR